MIKGRDAVPANQPRRGQFVVFEGGDGVGKTTHLQALARALEACGVDHLVTYEPGGCEVGRAIRGLLLDPASRLADRCEALLYAADKAQHVYEVVEPALAGGKVVICDRYVDSMLAYQGFGRELDRDGLEAIIGWATNRLRPDLTILLERPPAHALSEIVAKDRLEAAGLDFHLRAHDGFAQLRAEAQARSERYVTVDTSRSLSGNAELIREQVGALIGVQLLNSN